MQASRTTLVVVACVALLIAACGGGSPPTNPAPPPGAQTAPVSLTIRDTPPQNVTVLSFEVTVTQAVLQPGNVSLVTSPIEIELKQLEIETAFLNTANVLAATYNSIAITFTNPEITFLNNTGATLAGCANGQVCEISPPVTATVNYSGSPFPLTIAANMPVGLLVDVDLNSVITGTLSVDFNAAGGVTVVQLPPFQGTGQFDDIELLGVVTAKDSANSQFTLQIGNGLSLIVRVDNNTQFEEFDDIGLANSFASVAVGQILEVELRLMPGGMLVLDSVELEDADVAEELEGVIVNTANLPSAFDMVLLEEIVNVPGVEIGVLVRINVVPGAQFKVDDDGLNTSGLSFGGTSDLMVGQRVEIERASGPTGTNPPMIDANEVELDDSRFTARVQSVDTVNSSFVVDQLPSLFQSQGITQITVRVTPGETEFEDVSGLSALNANDTVSLRGLLFRNVANTAMPILAAEKVRRR